ncbi:hypothetical protein [Mesorhizobium sp. M0243]|uniref:hypothetical protein n=1 Tax=Mesorhizobium sp. M0243 TaxID=2956925 RepID=UPI003339A22B
MLDFLKIEAMMSETVDIKDELKRQVEKVVEARGGKSKRRGWLVGGGASMGAI